MKQAAKEKAAADKESAVRQSTMSRGGSRRGGDRSDAPVVGPDGWAVAGNAAARVQPPKAGDLSNFGKISKAAILGQAGGVWASSAGFTVRSIGLGGTIPCLTTRPAVDRRAEGDC